MQTYLNLSTVICNDIMREVVTNKRGRGRDIYIEREKERVKMERLLSIVRKYRSMAHISGRRCGQSSKWYVSFEASEGQG